MSDVSAIASSALAMNHSRLQEQITLSILKMNAQAEQAWLTCLHRMPAGLRRHMKIPQVDV